MSILSKLRDRTEPLNVAELAKLLDVTAATVQRWVRRYQVPAIRIGDVIRFDPGMLADWIELQSGHEPTSPPIKHGGTEAPGAQP
jgi:excisionase family DNA binding protein